MVHFPSVADDICSAASGTSTKSLSRDIIVFFFVGYQLERSFRHQDNEQPNRSFQC